jgi:hypothetical protein
MARTPLHELTRDELIAEVEFLRAALERTGVRTPEGERRQDEINENPASASEAVAAEIIELIKTWVRSHAEAVAWYETQPLSSFGNMSAADLVREGSGAAVKAHIKRIAEGGYS